MWLFLTIHFVFVLYNSTGSGVHFNCYPSSSWSWDLRTQMLPTGQPLPIPPDPELKSDPPSVCALSLYVTLPLNDSSSRGLWHDSQIKGITLPPSYTPTHTDHAAHIIFPSARTLTQITSHQTRGLNKDGSGRLSPDLFWSHGGIKLGHNQVFS